MVDTNNAIDALREKFKLNSNPDRAFPMSAYMKDNFPFFGIPATPRKAIQREWLYTFELRNNSNWPLIMALWNQPEREFQYVASDWLTKWKGTSLLINDIHFIEQLITTKSWWDSVDALAPNILNTYFIQFPEMEEPTIERWLRTDQLWLRRSCLIYQLKRKGKTDVKRLKGSIEHVLDDRQFFIQKAIGWSLRQFAKHDPKQVKEILSQLPIQGLALREASKYL